MAEAVAVGVRWLRSRVGMAIAAAGLVVAAFVLWPADASDLTLALQDVRRSDQRSKIDISDTALRFFPFGTSIVRARTLLVASGFKVDELNARRFRLAPNADREIFASRNIARWCLACSDEWRILVYSKDGRIVHVRGWIFYHSL